MTLDHRNISVMNFHYVRHSFERFLADASEAGISKIELWAAAPHFYIGDKTREDARDLSRAIRQKGLQTVAFTPEQCVYPINISAQEKDLRDRSIRYFLESMEFAVELGASALLVTPGGGYRDEPTNEAMTRCVDAIGLLCDRGRRLGVDLWMEALPPAWSNIVCTAQDMKVLFERVASPALYGIYDVAGAVMTNETAQDYFEALGDRIAHIHMTDSDAQGSHLAWGEGIIDLEELIQFLRKQNYEGDLTVELTNPKYNVDPKPPLNKSVSALRQALGQNGS